MPRVFFSACVTLTAFVSAASAEYFEGDGTTYTLGDPSAGNCNFMTAPAAARANYAAINNEQWAGMRNCGRCAEVSCSDARCADKSASVVVHILDRCPECKKGDLDLSPSVFTKLTGSTPSRFKIKWQFVDCPVAGGIEYCLKGGSNPFWTAIQPANTVAGVSSMLINGQTPGMVDSAYYYLLNGQSVTQTDLHSVRVTLTSVGGEVVEETVALTAGACTAGSKQFKAGNSGGGSQVQPQPQPPTPPATMTPPVTKTPPVMLLPTALPTPAYAQVQAATQSPPVASPTQSPTPAYDNEVQQDADKATPAPTTNTTGNGFSMDGLDAETAQPGTVSAPDDASSASTVVVRLTPSPVAEENRSGSPSKSGSDGGAVNKATTKSSAEDGGTSPVLIVLAVAAILGVAALAVVAAVSQKKKLDDKRADRADAAAQRSFDTFQSPVRVNSEITQL